jgi:hypothetical protein
MQGIYSYIPETSRVSGIRVYYFSYSVVKICVTCNAMSHDKPLLPLH